MNTEHPVENQHTVLVLAPAADAAGRTSSYVSMKYYRKCVFEVYVTQGNAATIALTPVQATAVAGTSSKAISQNCRIWSNLNTATNDTLVARTGAKDYTTDAGTNNKVVIFEIDAAELDSANSFDCLGITTGSSNAANITCVVAKLYGNRYPQATPPGARVD